MRRIKEHPTSKQSIWIEENWDKSEIIRVKFNDFYDSDYTNLNFKKVNNFIFEADLELDYDNSFKDCVFMKVIGSDNLSFNMYAGDLAKSIKNAKEGLFGFKLLDGISFGFSGRFYFNFGRKYNAIAPVTRNL